ncbi:MAG: gamma-glutamyltransferase [Gemmatimonadaceae bacterium]
MLRLLAAVVFAFLPSVVPAQQTSGAAGVAAASPLATEAGVEILNAGGSAVDAAVAVLTTLGLVEPQSSGIGGGGFLMHYEAATGKITMLDGRETAPAGASPTMFIGEDGRPMDRLTAMTSGRATGVPGVMPMLGEAHARFGKLPWSRLFRPAITAAESGFKVPPRLGRFVNNPALKASRPDVVALFSRPDGSIASEGEIFTNPAYGTTLRALATRGSRALHEGPIAQAIVDRVRQGTNPGSMTLADLAGYKTVERERVCRPYREHIVCVPPPPSSGVSVLQLLGILEHTDIARRGPADPQSWYLFAEASRLMYADREKYIADPAFANVPAQGLIDSSYISARAKLIALHAGDAPGAGTPPGAVATANGTEEGSGTTHFVIVDKEGNVVSMTATVESVFGSGRVVGGFILNNQMTDFSFQPVINGVPVLNAVAPGKRPRSAMLPAIILDRNGKFRAAIGSPGGGSILAYNAKAILGFLAWNLPMQQAINLPNIVASGTSYNGEASKLSSTVVAGLAEKGVVVTPGSGEDSGLHGVILRGPGELEFGADPRRDGTSAVIPGIEATAPAHDHGPGGHPAPRLGTVSFPNSGASAAQEPFLRGIALLHSFEYEDAGEAFLEAQKADPTLAVAYWAEALTYARLLWGLDDPVSGRATLARLGPSPEARIARAQTDREKLYGRAVEALYHDGTLAERVRAYVAALRTLNERYPDDLEARALLAISLQMGGAGYDALAQQALRKEAISLAQSIFEARPEHPGGAHYLIHATDNPEFAPLGLAAARAYAKIAPDADHALHMPSHIFVQIGAWDDVVDSNERSWAASRAWVKSRGAPNTSLSFHALWWLQYGYLQQGRYAAAKATIDTVDAVLAGIDFDASDAIDARYAVNEFRFSYAQATGDWSVYGSVPTAIPASNASSRAQNFAFVTNYGSAFAAIELGDTATAKSILETLQPGGLRGTIARAQLNGLLAKARGDREQYLVLLREAADADAKVLHFGPPGLAPAHELLGTELLEEGRYAEAIEAFRKSLELMPNRSMSLLGLARAQRKSGDATGARDTYRKLAASWHNADQGSPEVAEAVESSR